MTETELVKFIDEPLDLRWINGRDWTVLSEFDYHTPDGYYVQVPAGFVTDFASIPRVLWNILPPTGPYGKAAVLHDFMYRTGLWTPFGPACNRGEADGVLRDGMKDLGVGRRDRWAVYAGVRAGGWISWRRYRSLIK